MNGLYQKHRPKTLDGLLGQPEAVKIISGWLKKGTVPHAILMTGPSGCGKTTVSRILKRELGCKNQDFVEQNCADFRGIDSIREIRGKMGLSPIGKCRIYLLDECHQLPSASQSILLKMLEDTPSHVYFMLATTDPQKLLKTIITRCAQINVRSLSPDALTKLLKTTAAAEGFKLAEEVSDRIVQHCDGSARKALVLLQSVLGVEGEGSQLEAIAKSDSKTEAIQLARALISPRPNWKDVAAILKAIDLEEYESLRYMVLGYCKSVLLGGGALAPRAAMIIDFFSRAFYDSKQAGLIQTCWEVVHAKV